MILVNIKEELMGGKVRWGILSTANIGRARVIPAIHSSRNGVVAAVASRNEDHARDFAGKMDILKSYGNYEELLNDAEVDAIYIPLPNSLHAEWSIRCAEANKPTLCEKPLARNAIEAQRMVDAFSSKHLLFAEAFMYRFHPQTQRVKEMITGGLIGDVRVVQANFSFSVRSEDNIRLDKNLAGGALMDVGSYCVDLMRSITNMEPDTASATAQVGPSTGVDETLAGIMGFPSGAVGHFDCSLRLPWRHSYDIRGTNGRILVEEGFVMNPEAETVIHHWQGEHHQEIVIPPANHYTIMVEDFADALLDSRPPRFSPQNGVDNMRVLDRLYAVAGV